MVKATEKDEPAKGDVAKVDAPAAKPKLTEAEKAQAASVAAMEAVNDEAPSPTQAEMDEARLNLGKSVGYLTREAKSE